jgi:hypothetical protein
MATLHPPLSTVHPLSAGAYRERDILSLLEQGLPLCFDVFHSVDWAAMQGDHQSFGELDAVVVAPSGHVMLLEVKAGPVSVSENTLVKAYSNAGNFKVKDIGQQSRRQHGAMLNRLSEEGLSAAYLGHLLVLADHTVEGGTVAYPRERIVDATQLDSLCSLVKTALQKDALPDTTRTRVMDFWANRFDVHPDASIHMGQVQKANISLAEGLATWMPRITHAGGVYMVEATAGSGKSQLALSLLRQAASQHLRAAYLCYNRPLADHMVRVVPPIVEVSTFHEYCAEFSRKQGVEPDFKVQGVFADIENRLLEHADTQTAGLDLLVVDESQDFDPQWVQALLPRMKVNAQLYVLGDANQRLYERDEFDLSEAVHIRCMDNFRSPRKVVQTMNQLGLTTEPIQSRSVYVGQVPGFHTYSLGKAGKTASMVVLERCLQTLFDDSIRPDQIAVITFAGRDRSEALGRDKLAGLTLKRFIGKYDAASNPIWTSGELLVETLYRFKGQSASVVVLCEVDFEGLNENELHKLFVAFTRAQFRLECVLSERAAIMLFERT